MNFRSVFQGKKSQTFSVLFIRKIDPILSGSTSSGFIYSICPLAVRLFSNS